MNQINNLRKLLEETEKWKDNIQSLYNWDQPENNELYNLYLLNKSILDEYWDNSKKKLINQDNLSEYWFYEWTFWSWLCNVYTLKMYLPLVITDVRNIIHNLANNNIDYVVWKLVIDKTISSTDCNINTNINHAVKIFFKPEASLEDKKGAIKLLCDCLENKRKVIQNSNILSGDEKDLFNIANNFTLRHMNEKQKWNYDREIFYDWIFLTYYNMLKLIISLEIKYL